MTSEQDRLDKTKGTLKIEFRLLMALLALCVFPPYMVCPAPDAALSPRNPAVSLFTFTSLFNIAGVRPDIFHVRIQ